MLLIPLNPTLVLYTSWYGCSVFCRQFRMPLLQIVVLYNSSQDILKFLGENNVLLAEAIPGPYHHKPYIHLSDAQPLRHPAL